MTPAELKAFRIKHGFTQIGLADALCVGATAIATREKGKVEIDQAFIAKFNNFAATLKDRLHD